MPGVALVLTAGDVPRSEIHWQRQRSARAGRGRVNFIGDPVAVVFAETLAAAKAAVDAIQVDYKPLPGVFDRESIPRDP